jgi:TolB-like protein
MGEVYLAEDTGLKRQVALKRIAPALRADVKSRQRLWKEAQRASRLNDPHIASVYDVIEEGDEIFVVMEYVEGETLRHRLARSMTLREFLPIATQCAAALAAAHQAGLLHRDIKPENIMLTSSGQVKTLDFGVARELFGSDSATTQKTLESAGFSGTLAYMAPEVLEQREADARADIFSLGVVFYEALTGKNPFRRAGFLEICNAILHDEPPPLRDLNPEAPAELARIVHKMLAKNPAERYATAADLVVDLRAVAQSYSVHSASAGGRDARRKGVKRFLPAIAAFTVLVAALAAGGYWVQHQRRRRAEIAAAAAPRRIRSIAILPFRKIGGPGEFDYFGAGLADVLSAKLTNARLLEVHSPGATWNPEDSKIDPLDVGRKSKVDAVLSGSYQIEGATLSLSYTLLDVQDNVQIAGNAYTRPFTESIEVEHLLASEIVTSLKDSTNPDERARFTSIPTQKADAFQDYLRSNFEMERFWQRPSAEQLALAEQPLQDALRLDPRFTLALVSLARLHWTAAFWGYAKGPEILALAGQEADQAIQQDPGLGEAYAARALVQFQMGKLDETEESLRAAFSRSPNSALAFYAAGLYFLGRGLPDLGVQAFRRARDFDPQIIRTELSIAYRYNADLEAAEDQARKDLAEHPKDVVNQAALAHVLMARGRLAEAAALNAELLREASNDPGVQGLVALLKVLQHKPFSIQDWLQRDGQTYWADGGGCANVAEVLAVSRQKAEAVRWLRRAGELSMRNYPFLSRNPLYSSLRDDREFQAYLELVKSDWQRARQREEQDPLMLSKGS